MKFWTIVFSATFCLLALPVSVEMETSELYRMNLKVSVKPEELIPTSTRDGNNNFSRIALEGEGFQFGNEGKPELPRIYRWLVVDENAKYKLETTSGNYRSYKDTVLFPAQPDRTEDEVTPQFVFNKKAYLINKWYGKNRAELGKKIKLGSLTIQPVLIYPAAYNPVTKELRVYSDFDVKLTGSGNPESLQHMPVSDFAMEQARSLALNGESFIQNIGVNSAGQKNYLVLYAKGFETFAREAASFYTEEVANVDYQEAATTTEALKKQIQNRYDAGGLDAVLLYGDESKIPLKAMGDYKGDFYYSLVSGTDKISDIAVARIPVKSETQAALINNKFRRYHELQKLGHTNKNIMLIAHKENYPGKYTGNMENVRKLPNPKNLEFKTQYGGAGAKNSTVLSESQNGYAIINYRGHGSNTNWSSWGQDGKSFGFTEVEGLPNQEKLLPFIFNVACYNGSIQSSSGTLIEKQLFPSDDKSDLRGAVGTFGASAPSYTDVNHRFNINLFNLLQTASDTSIGNVYTAANNKLTKDSGGTPSPNVMMYMLFADPLMKPWIE